MRTKPYQERIQLERAIRVPFKDRLGKERQRLIILDGEIWSADNKRSNRLKMVLDTGAQISEIDHTFLKNLGYSSEHASAKPSRVHNGQSWMEGYAITIKQLKVERMSLKDFRVNVTALDSRLEFQGLLGLNFLEALGSISLDWRNGILELHPL